jgi:Pro-kumamolisin, activation domain/IPT/TIG domain
MLQGPELGAQGAGSPRPARRALIAALGASVIAAAVVFGPGGSVTASGLGSLTKVGVAPSAPAGATDLGPEAASAPIAGEIVLRPRDQQALESFVTEVSHRGSPDFGHYLARGEFAARFGPSSGTVAQLRAALAARGLAVDEVSSDDMTVSFHGSASAVEGAFATGIHRYRLRNGSLVRRTSSAPQLPSAVAGAVAAVVGLDTTPHALARHIHGPAAARPDSAGAAQGTTVPAVEGAPHACSQARAAAAHEGGLTDDEILDSYGAFGLYAQGDTGAGVHIGVFEEEPFLHSDIEHFDACYFGATEAAAMAKRLHTIDLEPGLEEGAGEGESVLDVEDVSAAAPGAEIDVYDAREEVPEIEAIVQADRDQVITSSYGEICGQQSEEAFPERLQAINYLLEEGAAQGQTFLAAAGDNGSDECEELTRGSQLEAGQNPISTDPLADEPYSVSVGGTTITEAGQPVREHAWNNGGGNGAGSGGIAQDFVMPSWQREATIPGISDGVPGGPDWEAANSVERRYGYPQNFCQGTLPEATAATPCRLEPDVSAQADWFTGAITIYSIVAVAAKGEEESYFRSKTGWVTNGGTSSSTPLWAGMLALVDASSTCRTQSATKEGIGFALPELYAIASNPTAYAASFNDVTEGNNDIYGLDGGAVFPARAGFDLATGLGSPRLTGPGGTSGLAYYLCSYAGSSARPTVSGVSPAAGSTAGGQVVKIAGSGFERAGQPDIAGVEVGAWQAPASAVHVTSSSALTLTLPPAKETLPAGTPAQPDGAGHVDIIVTLADGESSLADAAAGFLYVEDTSGREAPSITGLYPSGGSESAPTPVTIYGGGFTSASSVTFGGVPASSFKVLSPWVMEATPPAYGKKTQCAPLPTTGVYAGEGPANDICQTQVVVRDGSSPSATAAILPPLEGGEPVDEPDGAVLPPPGCGCELYAAPTEYDYAPAPTITSVSTSEGPSSLASEAGGTVVTLHGSGLSQTLLRSLEIAGAGTFAVYDTATELQLEAPALESLELAPSVGPLQVPITVGTVAGTSAAAQATYAGIPVISSVATGSPLLKDHPGAVDTGGAPLSVAGEGLAGQVTYVHFDEVDAMIEGSSGISYAFSEQAGGLSLSTVSELPALVNVEACTDSGCSSDVSADELYLYPPGQPLVETLRPDKGPSQGGTRVKVIGRNLGCALSASFGAKRSKTILPGTGPKPCGSRTELIAMSPAGRAEHSVPVTLVTWESYFTGSGDAPSSASFTYEP